MDIVEQLYGKSENWMEKVSDEQTRSDQGLNRILNISGGPQMKLFTSAC